MRLAFIPMNIASNNQLVPYHQSPQQLTSYWPRESVVTAANRFPSPQQNVRMPIPHADGHNAYTPDQNRIYTSSRRIKIQEMNRVGSRIDIYA